MTPPPRASQWRVAYDRVVCCDLAPGQDLVDWARGCRTQDTLNPAANFTRTWLGAQAAAGRQGAAGGA